MKKIVSSIGGVFAPAKKKSYAYSPAYQSYVYQVGKPVWSGRNYSKFSDEAYIKNVIAHQAVAKIALAAASVNFRIRKGSEYLTTTKNPLAKILHMPNPTQGGGELFESFYSYKLISGNTYLLAIGATDSAPAELYTLRPDRVSIIAGRDEMPAAYRYSLGNNKFKDYKPSEVLHLKFFHPLDDWYGLSPVEAAAYSIDQHNQAGAWNQALLQNGARPSGALVVKQADGNNAAELSDDQYIRIKAQIDEQYTGAANAGRPLLLEGGMDWKEMSMSPKDMDFIEMKNSAARDIALAFGVPPQLLGIPGDNTYSNLAEARLALWEQTVLPLVDKTLDALNNWLPPKFGTGLTIEAELDSVAALQPRRDALWDRVAKADFLTAEEKRKLLKV
jgi:HK97 family phage portal protein